LSYVGECGRRRSQATAARMLSGYQSLDSRSKDG